MKLKVGNKLHSIREERKLTQLEMSELLGISTSAYARLERSETAPDIEQLINFSKQLDIPIHEFLPETMAIHNSNNSNSQVGFVLGSVYYGDQELAMENKHLKEQVSMLKEKIQDLERIIELIDPMKKP